MKDSILATLRFLHLEDSIQDAELIAALLNHEWPDCVVRQVATREQFVTALQSGDFELILSDYTLGGFDGLSALELARKWCPEKPFIFLSGTIGEERAVEALQSGATDYVIKDRTARLVPAIRQALSRADETRRHQLTEEALRQNRERFRQIAEHVTDLIVLVDGEGRRLYGNPAYDAIAGVVDGGVGGDIFANVHPEDKVCTAEIFQEIMQSGNSRRSEFRIMRPDGVVRYVEAQCNVIRDARSKNLLIVARDVTERCQAEARIRQQAALLDKAQDAIVVQNVDGTITYWNKGAERIYGWTTGEACGRKASELLAVEPSRQHFAHAHALSNGEWRGELRHQTKAKGEVTVQSRWTLVEHDDHGGAVFLMINTDITDNKLLEAKFLRAQRMESMGMLVGGVAHDLNNVLAPILMSVDLLQTMVTDPRARALVNSMHRSAKHGAAFVHQLLGFARGAEGQYVDVDLGALLTEFVEFMGQTLRGNVQLELEFHEPPASVRADATQLKQVLMNLCINARDAMAQGGTITITLGQAEVGESEAQMLPEGRAGRFAVMSVTDTGAGITPADMERIFDPFYTTKEPGRGTGLGLSTVRGIVKGHGGFVTVASQPGHGTTFKIYLPIDAAMTAPAPAVASTMPTVLLVDDEEMVCNTLALLLKAQGYHVYTADDATEGFRLFQQRRDEIKLVITDLKMAGMNGHDLIAAVRAESPGLPVIALTGMANAQEEAAVNKAGARILPKPMTRATLVKAVESALASAA